MQLAKLTYDQVVDAAKRLPKSQRLELLNALTQMQTEDRARDLLEELGADFRMPPAKEKRMSKLLDKAKSERMTLEEQSELEDLIEEYDSRRLDLARAAAANQPHQTVFD